MRVPAFKRYGILFAMACSMVVAFSVVWAVPYVYTAIGFAVWAFAGHLITIDADLPGGWSNPDDDVSFPWAELTIKAAILLVLVGLVWFVPALRDLGGSIY